ncbi:MAG TPA: hypothetical protein VK760_05410, partial [Candidatus Acidoferrales bacterium]|nr:hypothetical protein [Candidatus Acidoferrales bacterium]
MSMLYRSIQTNRLRSLLVCAALSLLTACSNANTVPVSPSSAGGQPAAAPSEGLPQDLHLDPLDARQRQEAADWGKAHPLRIAAPHRENGAGPYLWLADLRGALWQTEVTTSPSTTGTKVVGAIY